MEAGLGRRLDYDDLLRILAQRVRLRPQLLLWLFEDPVKGHDADGARRPLRAERRRDEARWGA